MSLSWRGQNTLEKSRLLIPSSPIGTTKNPWSIGCTRPLDEGLYSPALVDTLVDGFTFLMPYYDYFSTLWADGEIPGRP